MQRVAQNGQTPAVRIEQCPMLTAGVLETEGAGGSAPLATRSAQGFGIDGFQEKQAEQLASGA